MNLENNFKLRWTSTTLKYLGIQIPPKLTDTYALNFPPLLREVRKLLDRWSKATHSWRCNILKMNIVPKFLYLFQALPISAPLAFFSQIQAVFTKFIWASRHPRINRSLLTLPKEAGGIEVPDLYKYYQAAQLSRIIDWCRYGDSKRWITIEQQISPIP